MNTGKVAFAPDYKSKRPGRLKTDPAVIRKLNNDAKAHATQAKEMLATEQYETPTYSQRNVDQLIANSDERSRLERKVIEAAKARRIAQETMFALGTEEGCSKYEAADWRFEATLTALIDFESKQETK